MQAPVRVGVDVGGTFTDLVVEGSDGDIAVEKVPSTPSDLAVGVMAALSAWRESSAISEPEIDSLVHGSTVGTNAVVEGTGAATGLLITEGFGAVPVVGTGARDEAHLVDPFLTEDDVGFLVPPRLTREVPGRVGADGKVVRPLDEEAARAAIRDLREAGVEAIAVCYLFSFLAPDHEERTLELIEEEHPDCAVSLSSRVLPRIREFPRTSTAAVDAYVKPVVRGYLEELTGRLSESGVATDRRYFMLSHGGLVPFETAAGHPVRTLFSGPAGGVRGCRFFGGLAGVEDIITMDMGGTSCDVAVIRGGRIVGTESGTIGGHHFAVPMLEIDTIGAGGGTVARAERGRLRVGPESAGADPGPVCFGQGGDRPTVTDADVLLGRLNPDALLGGAIDVDADRAESVVAERLVRPLGLADIVEAAAGVVEVVDDEMRKELRVGLARYGYDLRQFSLVACGGAGPTHASRVAAALGLPRVIVPPWPGLTSAVGLLATDVTQEYVAGVFSPLEALSAYEIEDRLGELAERAVAERVADGFDRAEVATERGLDLRYRGQGYHLTVGVGAGGVDRVAVRAAFDAHHAERFGHRSDEPLELVGYRVTSVVDRPDPVIAPGPAGETPDPRTHRPVYQFDLDEFVETPVYDRVDLSPGVELEGPAVVEQLDATTVIEPGQRARVDDYGNIVIDRYRRRTNP